jgi:hypothetical protein
MGLGGIPTPDPNIGLLALWVSTQKSPEKSRGLEIISKITPRVYCGLAIVKIHDRGVKPATFGVC